MLVLPDERRPLAELLRFLELGERLTHHCATAQARLAPTPKMRRFLTSQARQEATLPEVLNGIELLHHYPHPKYLTCIVSQQNRHDVLDVARFARAHGFIPVIGAYHWDIERYGKVDLTLQYERTVARKVFEQVVESDLVPSGYFRQYLHDNITWLSGKSLAPCDAGKYSIAIDASGNVAPIGQSAIP